MCILIDPTESRHRSRLPQAVIERATPLPGLERLTGSDILIAVDAPPDDVRDIAADDWYSSITSLAWQGHSPREIAGMVDRPVPFVLKVLKFRQACKTGLLVQRKTGRDSCSIIPNSHGTVVLSKMLTWCPECWLALVDVDAQCSTRGKLSINGKTVGYLYSQLSGALDAWKRRGGFVKWVPQDKDLMPWIARQLEYLRHRTEEKVLTLRKPAQQIVGPSDDKGRKLSVLASLKHVGPEKAKQLLEYYSWNLAAALEAVLDPSLPSLKNKPRGIGKVTVVENRKLFGLTESWMRLVVVAKVPAKESNEQTNT